MSTDLTLSVVTVPLVFTDGHGERRDLNLTIDLSDAKTSCPTAIAARLGQRFALSTAQVSAAEVVIQHCFQRHAIAVMQARGIALPVLSAPCYDLMCSSSAAAAAAAGGAAGSGPHVSAAPPRKIGDVSLPAATGEKSLLAKLVKKTGRQPKSAGAAASSSASGGARTSSAARGNNCSSYSSKPAADIASPAHQSSSAAANAESGSAAGGASAAPGGVPDKRKRERVAAHRDGDGHVRAAEAGTEADADAKPARMGRKPAAALAGGDDVSSAAAPVAVAAGGTDDAAGTLAPVGDASGSAPPAKRARAAPRNYGDEFAEDLRSRSGSGSGSGGGAGKGRQVRSSSGEAGAGDAGGPAAKKARSKGRAVDAAADEGEGEGEGHADGSGRRRKSKTKGERRRKSGASGGSCKDADAAAAEADEGGDDEDGNEDGNVDYCHHCRKAGDLVCCDRCPRSFHPPCMGVAVETLPDGPWLCPLCVEQLGPKRENEGRSDGKLCTVYFDGPFTAPTAKFAGDRRREMAGITAALLAHEFAAPFAVPVPEELGEDGYFDMIKKPMDLGTVAAAIESGKYGTGSSSIGSSFDAVRCAADLRLVFNNCIVFNKVHSCIWRMAEGLHFALETALRDRLEFSDEETTRLRRLRDTELKRIPRPEIKGL